MVKLLYKIANDGARKAADYLMKTKGLSDKEASQYVLKTIKTHDKKINQLKEVGPAVKRSPEAKASLLKTKDTTPQQDLTPKPKANGAGKKNITIQYGPEVKPGQENISPAKQEALKRVMKYKTESDPQKLKQERAGDALKEIAKVSAQKKKKMEVMNDYYTNPTPKKTKVDIETLKKIANNTNKDAHHIALKNKAIKILKDKGIAFGAVGAATVGAQDAKANTNTNTNVNKKPSKSRFSGKTLSDTLGVKHSSKEDIAKSVDKKEAGFKKKIGIDTSKENINKTIDTALNFTPMGRASTASKGLLSGASEYIGKIGKKAWNSLTKAQKLSQVKQIKTASNKMSKAERSKLVKAELETMNAKRAIDLKKGKKLYDMKGRELNSKGELVNKPKSKNLLNANEDISLIEAGKAGEKITRTPEDLMYLKKRKLQKEQALTQKEKVNNAIKNADTYKRENISHTTKKRELFDKLQAKSKRGREATKSIKDINIPKAKGVAPKQSISDKEAVINEAVNTKIGSKTTQAYKKHKVEQARRAAEKAIQRKRAGTTSISDKIKKGQSVEQKRLAKKAEVEAAKAELQKRRENIIRAAVHQKNINKKVREYSPKHHGAQSELSNRETKINAGNYKKQTTTNSILDTNKLIDYNVATGKLSSKSTKKISKEDLKIKRAERAEKAKAARIALEKKLKLK